MLRYLSCRKFSQKYFYSRKNRHFGGFVEGSSPTMVGHLPLKTLYIMDGTALLWMSHFGKEANSTFRDACFDSLIPTNTDVPTVTCNDGILHLPVGASCRGLASMALHFARFVRSEQPKYIAISFDCGKETFRNSLYEPYKQQRSKAPHDLVAQFRLVQPFMQSLGCECFAAKGYEGDDVMSTISSWALESTQFDHVVHVSPDKDMLQLVANPNVSIKHLKDKSLVRSEHVVIKFGVPVENLLDYFALVGDSADNIPGVKGVGPVIAKCLINHYRSIDELYERVFNSVDGLPELTKCLVNGGVKAKANRVRTLLQSTPLHLVSLYKQLITLDNEVQIILDELRSVTIEDLKYRGVRGVGDNVETPPHLWSKAFRRPVRMIEEMTYYK